MSTTTATAPARPAYTPEAPAPVRPARWNSLPGIAGALVLATALLTFAYAWAANHSDSDRVHYVVFWLAILVFLAPVGSRLVAERTPRAERAVLVALTGLFLFVPKFLLNPTTPVYHDELAHLRQIELLGETKGLYSDNPIITVLGDFPGLHAMVEMLHELTGLPEFTQATIVLALAHMSLLLGIFLLGERLLGSARLGAIAALLYLLNPSYMFFDAQLAYESVSLPLLVWTLVALSRGIGDRSRRGWLVVGLVLAAAGVITHHLTSYVLMGLLVGVALVTIVKAKMEYGLRRDLAPIVGFTVIVVAMTAAWYIAVASDVDTYLGPRITDGVSELVDIVQGKPKEDSGERTPFSGSQLPIAEQAAGFLAQPIGAFLLVLALLRLRRRRFRESPFMLVMFLLACAYFASLPFVLSTQGNEGARRSWGFSYIGLAIVLAPVLSEMASRARDRPREIRRRIVAAGLAAYVVVLVGNTASGLNPTYRFPGPYVFGSDTRSLTPELLSMSSWFRGAFGPGRDVVADRFSALPLAGFDEQRTSKSSDGFQVWQLYFRLGLPDKTLVDGLAYSGWDYLVVDRQMATNTPINGMMFDQNEPAEVHDEPAPLAALTKFERLPWTIKVFTSDNYDVYRFNPNALRTDLPTDGPLRAAP